MKRLFIALLLMVTQLITPATASTTKSHNFQAEVWADNWFALYINGKLVGQDSVPITTVRSFNGEKIRFSASYPFTIGLIVRDYTENESGLEYIGAPNQQIGDGGVIAQFRDLTSNAIVATTNSTWKSLVIAKAPLNPECEKSSDPLTTCRSSTITIPKSWSSSTFKDTSWLKARTYTKEEVGVKEGYFDFSWASTANLIWSSDLKLDNTVLLRKTVTSTSNPKLVTDIFTLASPTFTKGGVLPSKYTCDGDSLLPPLTWSGTPAATQSFVITFDTVPGPPRAGEVDTGKHAMFVLYNVPAIARGFTSLSDVTGTFGQNFQGKNLGYTPPCSQGPGAKTYTFSIYALSSQLNISASQATESEVEKLMQGKILASDSLSVTYARSGG